MSDKTTNPAGEMQQRLCKWDISPDGCRWDWCTTHVQPMSDCDQQHADGVIQGPHQEPAAPPEPRRIEELAGKLAEAIYWNRNYPTRACRDLLIEFAEEIKREVSHEQ